MALTEFALELLAPYLRGAHVLAFGYPDLLVTPSRAAEILHLDALPPAASIEIGRAHKQKRACTETRAAFAAVGAELVCIDIAPSRGVERVVDLNYPLHSGPFDLVIDAGTIEHCANIGQALMNAAGAVRPGGCVFHSPPLSMMNHGFYNICPTLLVDFYAQNGWLVKHLSGFVARGDFERFEIDPTARTVPPVEAALYFLAHRGSTAGETLSWPMQAKYRRRTL